MLTWFGVDCNSAGRGNRWRSRKTCDHAGDPRSVWQCMRKENECYEIMKEAKATSWSPLVEIKAFMPAVAGESERQIGGEQAAVMGPCALLSDAQREDLAAVAPWVSCAWKTKKEQSLGGSGAYKRRKY